MARYNGKENRAADHRKPCFRYMEGKGCKYGESCHYSHDRTATNSHDRTTTNHRPRQQASTPGIAGQQAKLREWRYLIPRSRPYTPLGDRLSSFFRLASEMVNEQADPGVIQQLVVALATEEGLERVKELTDSGILTTRRRKHVWDSQLCPYLGFLSHPLVMDSSILENEVGMLFNYLIGFNGTRLARLSTFVHALLLETKSDITSASRILELFSLVLLKTLSFNTATTVNECMQAACRQLLAYANSQDTQSEDDFNMRKAREHLRGISIRLDIAEGIKQPQDVSSIPQPRARFVLEQDLPGHLSSDGQRHCNDHSDITEISILPPLEEIQSVRTEYRPLLDPLDWHLQGVRGLLDRHFRLIREDTVGQLRDSVRSELELLSAPHGKKTRNESGLRVFSYPNAYVSRMGFDRRSGFTFVVHCRHPPLPKGSQTASKRKKWWEQSKRMQPGALVCLVDEKSVLFCRVYQLPMNQFAGPEISPASDGDIPPLEVHLQLAEPSKVQVEHEMRHLAWGTPPSKRSLVEFPGVLLDSFKPVLEALQKQYAKTDLSFAAILAPTPGMQPPSTTDPPLYSLKPKFSFDLTSICKPGTSMAFSVRNVPDVEGLCARTTLDESQARALFNSLRHGLALTQGPPGTGKSYTGECLIKILLANGKKAGLGPIVCVCYTNHALDQLLEHLWKSGTKQIVRIGSQSKSEVLEAVNLRAISRDVQKSKTESKTIGFSIGALKDMEKEVPEIIDHLPNSTSPTSVLRYLKEANPRLYHYFSGGEDEEGFIVVARSKDKLIQAWLNGGERHIARVRPMGILHILPPQNLTNPERRALYDDWVRKAIDKKVTEIADGYSAYETHTEEINKVRREVDLRCLRTAQIVGVTTTGLARNLQLLRKLNSKVLVCEEAGEVLEGHLLTALLPSIEHAIFIGDHQQLRPQIQNYELQSSNPRGEKYSLDMSLFERLVQPARDTDPRVPYDTLDTQRRMHPSISRLIRATLYPRLEDAPRVHDYPPVSGMKNRLFWFDHTVPEVGAEGGSSIETSHSNEFEVDMTTALVSHLVRQGVYEKDDIAVLTPYLGQLHKLRRQLSKVYEIVLGERDVADLEREGLNDADVEEQRVVQKNTLSRQLRIATVDNFQGEEAKVVVISLVRSNRQNKCGFLRTSNRINVLLSRAQHGMYIIGNSNTYGHVDMWHTVIDMLKERNDFGDQLELQCPRHPKTPIVVSQPDHFAVFSPEGGCGLPCEKRLGCGHRCTSRCHSDALHMAVRCLEPCPRSKKGCDHPCPAKCGDPCERKCSTVLRGKELALPCGHTVRSPTCWDSQHPEGIICRVQVNRVVSGCSHQVKVPCYLDVESTEYRCTATCRANLTCGHQCARQCHMCRPKNEDGKLEQANHKSCVVRCGRNYAACGHSCQALCHSGRDCEPCSERCEVRCSHSRCSLKCSEPCAPCADSKCSSQCPHSKCTMPCAAPCDWLPCSKRCTKELSCGHQCPSICGEPCPPAKFCQTCCEESILSTVVDMLEFREYGEVDLDEDPCIFPDCDHIKTVVTLDGLMDMSSHYITSPEGEITGIKAFTEPLSDKKTEAKGCPECRRSLRNISRYGRIVRRALLWESHQKFMGWANSENNHLRARLLGWEEEYLGEESPAAPQHLFKDGEMLKISGNAGQIIHRLLQFTGRKRYYSIEALWNQMKTYLNRVRREEQPFQRVYDHVQHSRRQNQTTGSFLFDPSVVQARGEILGLGLQIRCIIAVLTDFAKIRDEAKKATTVVIINMEWVLEQCEKLIALSENKQYPRHQVEGHIYLIRLCSLAIQFLERGDATAEAAAGVEATGKSKKTTAHKPRTSDQYVELGKVHVDMSREIIQENASCEVFTPEVDAAAKAIRGGTFYEKVTAKEMEAIANAMRVEFRGSGHWYTCTNGHPFTIGECGMPMELARCPECRAGIGGRNHEAVEGVVRYQVMENM